MKPELSGLGGWLILIQIGLYLTLIQLVIQIVQFTIPSFDSEMWDALTSKEADFYHALWKPTILLEAVFNLGMFAFTVICLAMMYMRNRLFPKLMIVYYSVSLLIGIVDYALVQAISTDMELDLDNSLRDTFRGVVTCAIWIPYFLRSKRVAHTFVR
ncbi:DUF2569 domain-containing protein [Cohnella rhizosphaerae]|uniref:DUF2569 domain-containing protein n=1 Tax=Cohnella rhizosphaerae TaxID=1457232 RepID=A0A9X4QVW1_9BACL|nr:DUF2569 domain-containing protein [Cohnella rhizosphaerae]MDG0813776.1 DUF2569 domain-containing protein [Cohnella rhizosphaerae]